jgi:dTDP-4-amino-4,6-dideoxygalactose transaminase
MPELSAALARAQLAKYDRILTRRREIAAAYDARLAGLEREGRLAVVRAVPGGESSHHIHAVLVDPAQRDAIVGRLAASGVEAASHFVPLHLSPFGSRLDPDVSLPCTERAAASIVRLPIHPLLSDDDVQQVADAVAAALDA